MDQGLFFTNFASIGSGYGGSLNRCRIPDDCIDPRRYPLLAAREAMRQLVDDLLGRSMLASGGLS